MSRIVVRSGLTAMISDFQERSPNGLTSKEIAERLGATAGNISSRLSKMAAYGIIGKAPYSRGGNVYRPLTYEQAAAWLPAR
jgi:predicted transcriptional regulator